MVLFINGADHNLLIGASVRIIVPTCEPTCVGRDNEDVSVVSSSASSSLARPRYHRPGELVTKAPLERLTDTNLPCHRRPRRYSLAPAPFRSRISLYIRPPVENRRSDAICRPGDPIRSRADLIPVVRQALLEYRRDTDMIKTLKHEPPFVRISIAVATVTLLVGLCSQAWASGADPLSAPATQVAFLGSQGPTAGQSVFTMRGPAFVTGHLGSMETTTLPGSGGQGLLMNNGNGTSTLIVPGGIPQTVATPR